MKSVENICCKEKPALTFPRLMKSTISNAIHLVSGMDGDIFHSVVVSGKTNQGVTVGKRCVGKRCAGTGACLLEDYDGTITLSNS